MLNNSRLDSFITCIPGLLTLGQQAYGGCTMPIAGITALVLYEIFIRSYRTEPKARMLRWRLGIGLRNKKVVYCWLYMANGMFKEEKWSFHSA